MSNGADPNSEIEALGSLSLASASTVTQTSEAGAIASAGASHAGSTGGAFSGSFSSMGDLQRKNPELYNMMLMSLAQNMISQMTNSNDRVVQAWKQMRQQE